MLIPYSVSFSINNLIAGSLLYSSFSIDVAVTLSPSQSTRTVSSMVRSFSFYFFSEDSFFSSVFFSSFCSAEPPEFPHPAALNAIPSTRTSTSDSFPSFLIHFLFIHFPPDLSLDVLIQSFYHLYISCFNAVKLNIFTEQNKKEKTDQVIYLFLK